MFCNRFCKYIFLGSLIMITILLIPIDYVTFFPKQYLIPTYNYMHSNFITYSTIIKNDVIPHLPCVSETSYSNCVEFYDIYYPKFLEYGRLIYSNSLEFYYVFVNYVIFYYPKFLECLLILQNCILYLYNLFFTVVHLIFN